MLDQTDLDLYNELMQTLQTIQLGAPETCPYLEKEVAQTEFFFAYDLNQKEFDQFLSKGWRKFGIFFFRPNCPACQACRPLRVNVKDFSPSKSQRRILKKNSDLRVEFGPLEYSDEIYQLYLDHSKERFEKNQAEDKDQFIETHFLSSVPSGLSRFYLEDKLIAAGFLDLATSGLSSVYFVFDPKFSSRSLGTFGALKEIEYAKEQSLPYYYLGYWVEQNKSMQYKSSFRPYELYDWNQKIWLPHKEV